MTFVQLRFPDPGDRTAEKGVVLTVANESTLAETDVFIAKLSISVNCQRLWVAIPEIRIIFSKDVWTQLPNPQLSGELCGTFPGVASPLLMCLRTRHQSPSSPDVIRHCPALAEV